MMPRYRQLMMVDVPPLLMSGSGCPVTGAKPTATSHVEECLGNQHDGESHAEEGWKIVLTPVGYSASSEQEDDVEECNQCGSPYTHLFDDDGIDEVWRTPVRESLVLLSCPVLCLRCWKRRWRCWHVPLGHLCRDRHPVGLQALEFINLSIRAFQVSALWNIFSAMLASPVPAQPSRSAYFPVYCLLRPCPVRLS